MLEVKITVGEVVETFTFPKTKKGNRESIELLKLIEQDRLECEYYYTSKALKISNKNKVRFEQKVDVVNSQITGYNERLEQIEKNILKFHILVNDSSKLRYRELNAAKLKLNIERRNEQTIKIEKYKLKLSDYLTLLNTHTNEYNRLFIARAEMKEPEQIKIEINHITI